MASWKRNPSLLPSRADYTAMVHREGALIQAERERQARLGEIEAQAQRAPLAPRPAQPVNEGALQVQALVWRRQGLTYADIGARLECSAEYARRLVQQAVSSATDEAPETTLGLHGLRLDGLLATYYPLAIGTEGIPPDPKAAQVVLDVLKLHDRLGPWLALLPRRGQGRQEEDDHAEIKAILLRAEEYGPPPGQGDMPHGLPSLDWKPAEVDAPSQDTRSDDGPQAPGESGVDASPHTRPSKLW